MPSACSIEVCANDVAVAPGRMVYTQWLNERGGIEADLTVTRLAETRLSHRRRRRNRDQGFQLAQRHIGDAHCVLTNVTSGMGVLVADGAAFARSCCSRSTPDDLSDAAFPFATSRVIELGYALVRASRITYVGELGWELYVPTEFMPGVYETLCEAGGALRPGARRLPCAQLAAHRKGLPSLGPRHHRRGHAAGSRPRLCGEVRQAGRLHRPRCAAAADADRHRASGCCNSSSKSPSRCSITTNPSGSGDASSASCAPACTATRWAQRSGLGYVDAGAGARCNRHDELRDRGRRHALRGDGLAAALVRPANERSSEMADRHRERHEPCAIAPLADDMPSAATAWIATSTATMRSSPRTWSRSSAASGWWPATSIA